MLGDAGSLVDQPSIERHAGAVQVLQQVAAAQGLQVAVRRIERRRIEMELPEGLLELQAPLSAEEKQRQKTEAGETRAAGVRRKRRR